MKSRIIQFIPTMLVLFGLGLAPISYQCIYSGGNCYSTWVHQIYPYFTNPLYNFSLFVLPIAIILIFISRSTFNAWFKLAAWAIPLSILYIATTPAVDTSFLPFHRDDAARLAGGVFVAVSLILIIWKWFAGRRRS